MSLIAITGGTGFLGTAVLAEFARDTNTTVRVLTRTPRTDVPGTIVGDVTDPGTCRRFVAGVDVVIHIAGLVRSNDVNALEHVNVKGTQVLAGAMRDAGTPRLIHVSSAGIYGRPGLAVDETRKSAPFGPYETSKVASELAIVSDSAARSITIIRPSNVIGRGHPRRPLERLFRRLASGAVVVHAGAWTNYVDVLDVARVIRVAATANEVPGRLNVNVPMPMTDFVRCVADAVNGSVRVIELPSALGMMAAPVLRRVARSLPTLDRAFAVVDQTHYVTSNEGWFLANGLSLSLASVLHQLADEYAIR